MNIDEAFGSALLTKADIERPVQVVIESVQMERVGGTAGEAEQKPVMAFEGCSKRLAMGKEMAAPLKAAWGSDTDNWIGHEVEVFVDPTIKFKGTVVGGIRLRIVKAPEPTPPAAPVKPPGKTPKAPNTPVKNGF